MPKVAMPGDDECHEKWQGEILFQLPGGLTEGRMNGQWRPGT